MTITNKKKIADKITGYRHIYATDMFKMLNNMNKCENEFSAENKYFKPAISLAVYFKINKELRKVREDIINHIIAELNKEHKSTVTTPNVKRFSQQVIDILEKNFKIDKYPREEEKARIASQCNISVKQVNNWFTNKRNRSKSYRFSINDYYA